MPASHPLLSSRPLSGPCPALEEARPQPLARRVAVALGGCALALLPGWAMAEAPLAGAEAAAATAATSTATASAEAPAVRVLRGPAPNGGGHGSPDATPHDEISPAQREAIWRQLRDNQRRLPARAQAGVEAAQPKLSWPMRQSARSADPDYHGISNFVDRNPAFPNQLLDYNCGNRSYDTASGYNHQGVDYFTWPFGWLKMSEQKVEVIAAAPGRIIGKDDGNADQSCGFNNNPWNAVYVEHSDGSVAWYGHLKNGSTTTKAVGDSVSRGEYLGVVGSSGNSTGPHLHMELYDSAGNPADPYLGACNALANAWWRSQRPYADAAINQVITGWAPVNFGTCPNVETPNIRDSFSLGARVYFTTFYHDQQAGQVSNYSIHRPDGSLYSSWSHSSPNTYPASWWYWYFDMPTAGPAGTWKFTVNFQGSSIERFFNLGAPAVVTVQVPNGGESYAKGSSVTLKWAANIGGPVRIELWKAGNYARTLFKSTPNDGKQPWTVPTNLGAGNYKIRVIDLADETVLDNSDLTFQVL